MPLSPSRSLSLPFDPTPNSPRAPLIDASALAVELGVSRDWVYEHAAELGALRLGSGPKARLRFDPVAARAALACWGSERSQASDSALALGSQGVGGQVPRSRRRSLATGRPQPGSILPVRPRRKAAGRAAE